MSDEPTTFAEMFDAAPGPLADVMREVAGQFFGSGMGDPVLFRESKALADRLGPSEPPPLGPASHQGQRVATSAGVATVVQVDTFRVGAHSARRIAYRLEADGRVHVADFDLPNEEQT